MYVPANRDPDSLPYTKRPVLRRNSALFVDGKGRSAGGAPRVVPQIGQCVGREGLPCGYYPGMVCRGGECVFA
jgi:hypothetical protein